VIGKSLGYGPPPIINHLSRSSAPRLARLLLLKALMSAPQQSIEFLMIDDNPEIAEFFTLYLQEKRHTCATINDSSAVLDWLRQNRCEVAIVDLNMQPVDGISLITHIREMKADLPIVVFTGFGYDEAKMQAALRAGANGYVSKTLPFEQLYCTLARVLATARHQSRQRQPRLAGVA
jgi:two-component system, OmpR family, response regulator VanR